MADSWGTWVVCWAGPMVGSKAATTDDWMDRLAVDHLDDVRVDLSDKEMGYFYLELDMLMVGSKVCWLDFGSWAFW